MSERLAPEQADSLPDIPEPAENPHLVGHDEAAAWFAGAWRTGKMHHAALLTGPQGIGKATFAYHLAFHMLTERDRPNAPETLVRPNPAHPVWRQIASGAHPAVLHLTRPPRDTGTGYKNFITVDEIRRLGHFLSMTTHDRSWRVVIVDPAEQMNTSAANALLKSLEEPPRDTLFMLVSHAPGRLLPTIRSRCQVHRLRPLEETDLLQALSVLHEDAPEEPQARQRLIDLAEGSVRNALLLTRHGGLDVAEAVDRLLDQPRFDTGEAIRIAQALAGRDAEIALDLFNRHVGDRLGRDAVQAARAGDTIAANGLARLWEETRQTIIERETYNLDKRQHVSGLLHRLHAAIHR
ncbi:MAG: DNA polymerase III subunit delta' [Zhengella sp.]|uniref:DNA polymerase III subunit delta' n=1 Tax=Zhengella sp. TaxID=2282762 RepID=UPI001D5DD710|nr:DNA polymerase III subunit delta' [Notoacmeibacter sp.]MCC0028482.1 DNA polymerase III subunit delta' [Brucellaceae bacterium]